MRAGWFREKAVEALKKGRSAKTEGDYKEARYQYLAAADFLAQAAANSDDPKLQATWAGQSKELLKTARALPKENAPKKETRPAHPQPDSAPAEDEDGKKPDFTLTKQPTVGFDDIVGLEDLKKRIRWRVIEPIKYPEAVEKYKRPRGDRIILMGPPGCGKTMFAKAIAAELEMPFFEVHGSAIYSKWVGESQKNVAQLFSQIFSESKAVVFMDEMDGILAKRGSSSTVANKVVNEFLSFVDGMRTEEGTYIYIGASNRPWDIDDAMASRFGGFIYVPLPDAPALEEMIRRHLRDVPCEPDLDISGAAKRLEGFSGRDLTIRFFPALTERAFRESTETGSSPPVTSGDLEAAVRKMGKPLLSEKDLKRFLKYTGEDLAGD